ncbi:leukotriene B4 receptor 1 [Denticeps clupeoides]|nr:leukotriene B4 receptor 1-like [Denticeps clupeoides]
MSQLQSSNSTFFANDNRMVSGVLGVCCILGVPGNMAVLVVLRHRLRKDSFTLWMMLSLAVSDLLTLLTLPVWIQALQIGWNFGVGSCKLISYLVYWSLYTSVLCVTMLSIQRYIQVLYPKTWAGLKAKLKKVLLGFMWALGSILASHALVQREVRKENDGLQHCLPHYRWEPQEKVATLVMESLLMFVIPFTILASLYSSLQRRVNRLVLFNSRRMTRLVSSIIVVFFIFSFPIHVNNFLVVIAIWTESESLQRFSELSRAFCGAMTFINSCVNPFLYAFSHRALHKRTLDLPSLGSKVNCVSETGSVTV